MYRSILKYFLLSNVDENGEKNANSSAYRKEPVVDGEAEIVIVELDERLPQVS